LFHLNEVGNLGVEIIYATVANVMKNQPYNRTLAGHADVVFAQLIGVLDRENNLSQAIYTSDYGKRLDSIVNYTNVNYDIFLQAHYTNTKKAWTKFSTDTKETGLSQNIQNLLDICQSALDTSVFKCNQIHTSTFCVAVTNNIIKMLMMDSAIAAVNNAKIKNDLVSKLGITKSCVRYLKQCY